MVISFTAPRFRNRGSRLHRSLRSMLLGFFNVSLPYQGGRTSRVAWRGRAVHFSWLTMWFWTLLRSCLRRVLVISEYEVAVITQCETLEGKLSNESSSLDVVVNGSKKYQLMEEVQRGHPAPPARPLVRGPFHQPLHPATFEEELELQMMDIRRPSGR